jgi:hypothetical protein
MHSPWNLPAIQWSIIVLVALMFGWLARIIRLSTDRNIPGRSIVGVIKADQG